MEVWKIVVGEKGKDGRDDGVSHRSKALAFLSFNISGIGQVTCYLRDSILSTGAAHDKRGRVMDS
jgi:hypothetical protein